VLGAARLAVGLRRRAAVQLATLRAALPDQDVLYLPEQFGRAEGPGLTRALADRLGEELG
jgi:hypothetical protein